MNFLLGHAKVGASVRHQLIILDEGALIEEQIDALSGRQFVVGMLLVDTGLATSHDGLILCSFEALGEGLLLL